MGKVIGGYFELELRQGEEYHKGAIRLNSGRSAFECILREMGCKKIYLPYYTCDVVFGVVNKLNITSELYHINKQLEPIFDFDSIGEEEAFFYTNYFGLKDEFIKRLACKNLIIDNSQAFYSMPVGNAPTFYSCRKFFGVPDGAYLYLTEAKSMDFNIDHSYDRCSHLLKRGDDDVSLGFLDFNYNEKVIDDLSIRIMSELTRKILKNIDYESIRRRRRANYYELHQYLGVTNRLKLDFNLSVVPMVYPYWVHEEGLRDYLIKEKIFTAQYWPNVLNGWCRPGDIEYDLAKNVVHLPVDQRYYQVDMEVIVLKLEKFNGCVL